MQVAIWKTGSGKEKKRLNKLRDELFPFISFSGNWNAEAETNLLEKDESQNRLRSQSDKCRNVALEDIEQ